LANSCGLRLLYQLHVLEILYIDVLKPLIKAFVVFQTTRIVAVLVFGAVLLQVLGTDAYVDSTDTELKVAPRSFNSIGVGFANDKGLRIVVDALVVVAEFRDMSVWLVFVSHNGCAWLDVTGNELVENYGFGVLGCFKTDVTLTLN